MCSLNFGLVARSSLIPLRTAARIPGRSSFDMPTASSHLSSSDRRLHTLSNSISQRPGLMPPTLYASSRTIGVRRGSSTFTFFTRSCGLVGSSWDLRTSRPQSEIIDDLEELKNFVVASSDAAYSRLSLHTHCTHTVVKGPSQSFRDSWILLNPFHDSSFINSQKMLGS